MFNNAQNTYIAGGLFNITNDNKVNGPASLGRLHKRAAPNAILNAGGRADEVRCHPGTRKGVISRIEQWRDAQDDQTPPIFWLRGPAGAGKSAIAQTIAERCTEQGVPQANFFFFRTDTSRNKLSPLVATLVHQITQLYPALCDPVTDVLSSNPLILDSTLEDQLTKLIVAPLQAIQQSSLSHRPPLLLIDGLDECEEKRSQQRILDAFDKILTNHHPCPFRLLVASRDESQIQAAFNNISSRLLLLYLDGQYSPESDIRTFVNDKFEQIRKTHHLAHTLNASWPSVNNVEDIVKKSSNQFIYAATVMRFILDSSASPTLSLARVQGRTPVSTKSPFFYLDAIYTCILSQINDQEELKDILHAHLLKQKLSNFSTWMPNLVKILSAYNPKYTEVMVHSCLANLTPIARCKNDFVLLFHHASFPDYLLDRSRSGNYFVDVDTFNWRIQPAIWKACDKLKVHTAPWYLMRKCAQRGVMQLHQLPPGLLDALMVLGPFCLAPMTDLGHHDLFIKLYSLCDGDDDVTKYKRILRGFIDGLPLGQDLRMGREPQDYECAPFSRRYFAMTCIDRGDDTVKEPVANGWIDVALRPQTGIDIQETALWLNNLLRRIHRQKYHSNIHDYKRLLRKWIIWAVQNGVPLEGVINLPNAWWYLQRSKIKTWVVSHLGRASRPE